jgi:hypothetical protein
VLEILSKVAARVCSEFSLLPPPSQWHPSVTSVACFHLLSHRLKVSLTRSTPTEMPGIGFARLGYETGSDGQSGATRKSDAVQREAIQTAEPFKCLLAV